MAAFPVSLFSEGQFVLLRKLNGAMSSFLLNLCSANAHGATLPIGKFEQAVHEARSEANASKFLDLVYKVTFLVVLFVPKFDMLKFSSMTLSRYKSSAERNGYCQT